MVAIFIIEIIVNYCVLEETNAKWENQLVVTLSRNKIQVFCYV